MEQADRQDYIARYEGRLREFGYSPETLGWGRHGRQEVRFAVLAEMALRLPDCSVLDVGCGFADLYDFLKGHGWRGQYTGVDLVPGLLDVARQRHPGLDLRQADIAAANGALQEYDFVIASGVFNAELKAGDNREHIRRALAAMYARARVAVCVDFMTTYVDFRKPGSWHTDPAWAYQTARELSPRVSLRADYMPFEFTLFIFKDNQISERKVFRAREREAARAAEPPVLDVVIPVYNEEPGIPALLERLDGLIQQVDGVRARVTFVDDHSTDRSGELLKAACAGRPDYRYLRLASNAGSHVAILAGLERAAGACAVFLASDLQDPPELIPEMLRLWRGGNQVVWAVRRQREGVSRAEKLLARTFYYLLNRLGRVQLPPSGSDFALLDRKVIDALMQSVGANPSLGGEIARLGFRQAAVPYTKGGRRFGRSKWNLERKLRAFADAFVLFSYKPLRAMSYLGMACSLLGFLYALAVMALRLFASAPIEGWASLMVVVLFVGGVQMIMLGVLGEYLWRTLEETRRRPRYALEDSCNLREEN